MDEPLTPFDRIAPMSTGGTPITGNASEVSIGDAAFTSETICRSSVFFFAVADKEFYDRSLTHRLSAVHERESDVPPSCVVGISQTRLSGTGLCHFIMRDAIWGTVFRHNQFRPCSLL